MRKLTVFLALGIILGAACSPASTPATSLPGSASTATVSEAASPVPSGPESTAAPLEPTLIPPPVLSPESFAQVKVEHEYWPAIRQAAGLFETIHFGRSQTAWALSPDGRYIAVAGCDGEAGDGDLFSWGTSCQMNALSMEPMPAYGLILDAKTENVIATLPETGQKVTIGRLAFTRDSNKLIYAVDTSKFDPNTYAYEPSGKTQIWDIPSGRLEPVPNPDTLSFVVSPDEKWRALEYADASATEFQTKIWDVAAGKFAVEPLGSGLPASFSTDGQRLLVDDTPYFTVYDTSTWQKVSQQLLKPDEIWNTWAISPDLSLLAICYRRTPGWPLRIWNIATGQLIQTLTGKWERCGRVIFTPDSRLLLRFDENGSGPAIWWVDGWKLARENAFEGYFIGHDDHFVDRMQFTQDGRSVLVGTFMRLTLYSLPAGVAGAPATPAAVASTVPATEAPAAELLPEIPAMSCDIMAQGWVNVHLQPCLTPTSVFGGEYDGQSLTIDIRDSNLNGITFLVPPTVLVRRRLVMDKYIIGDRLSGSRITARFDYYDPDDPTQSTLDVYYSYDGGTLVITQTSPYITGTFSFGARTLEEGRQVTVQGSFENIPFVPVNIP